MKFKTLILLFVYSALLFANLTLSSCGSSPQTAISELEELRDDLKENSADYSASDWEDAVNDFMDICYDMQDFDMTPEELHHIGVVKGEIVGIFSRSIKNDIDYIGNCISTESSGFKEGYDRMYNNEN